MSALTCSVDQFSVTELGSQEVRTPFGWEAGFRPGLGLHTSPRSPFSGLISCQLSKMTHFGHHRLAFVADLLLRLSLFRPPPILSSSVSNEEWVLIHLYIYFPYQSSLMLDRSISSCCSFLCNGKCNLIMH